MNESFEELPKALREKIVKGTLGTFFDIWVRFAVELNKELKFHPPQWDFIIYHGGRKWDFKKNFNFSELKEFSLEDKNFPYNQALIAEFYPLMKKQFFRIDFVFEEGREYTGIETIVAKSMYNVYQAPVRMVSQKEIRKALGEVCKIWMKAQMKNDYSIFWDYCKENLRKGIEI
ncbi:MAG: hypothetical protein AB1779_07630 [Candidatus Thermoplasmatota archaeon]